MNYRISNAALAVAVALSLLFSIFAYRAANLARSENPSVLNSVQLLLQERQIELKALQETTFTEPNQGILGSYLAKIRRDGVPKHADMKQRLDALSANTISMLTLIDMYEPQAVTAEFKAETKKFRSYAVAWSDRWNSVMEIFMAGGNYPAAEVPLPAGFEDAVRAELAASR